MKLQQLLAEMNARMDKFHPQAWRGFGFDDSKELRAFHTRKALEVIPNFAREGCCYIQPKRSKLIIAQGFDRLVVGDYGAYLEISKDDIWHVNITPRWPGTPSRPVKYIWMVTKDNTNTKVYFQQATVNYADYKVGYYYVAPADVVFVEKATT